MYLGMLLSLSANSPSLDGLFGDTTGKKRLRLADSKTVGDGVTINIYEPAGEQAKPSDSP